MIDATLLGDLLAYAKQHGATDGDAIGVGAVSTEVRVRMGSVETSTRSESHEVGLRVFVGDRSAMVSSNDLRPSALRELADVAIAAAKHMDADAESRVARNDELAEAPTELELYDAAVLGIGATDLIELARAAEDAALQADARIANSEGGEASAGESAVTFVTMGGVQRERRSTSVGVVAVPIAAQDGAMEVDWWYASRRRLDQLPDPTGIGRKAAERALRRLGARGMGSGTMPVIFEAPVASRVLGDFVSGLSGERVARKASYLADQLGKPVAAADLALWDDPLLPWGPASRAFDGEGFASRRLALVQGGVLQAFLTNLRTAARIGCAHGRNASRGVGGAPGVAPTHVHMANGSHDLAGLMREVGRGLLVTSTMGHGTDLIRGSFSQGATGLYFENGEVQYPVSEITVAGDFGDLMRGIVLRGDDLDPHRGVSAPSFVVDKLTIAGAG
ncbi:MAG: Peptidase [Pseudomonadota bacterium]